jgi:hypothetical protein
MTPNHRATKRFLAVGSLAVFLAVAPAAFADPTAADKETARSLAEQGGQQLESGNYTAAAKSYGAAHAIMNVPTTALGLGKAQEKLGMLVEARDTLLFAVRYPVKPGEPAPFTRARAEADQLAEKIAARIPSLQVSIEGLAASASPAITLDGRSLPSAATGVPLKVNPGKHTVVVEAPGYKKGSAEATVAEGEAKSVRIAMEADASAAPVAAVAPVPAGGAAAPSTTSSPPADEGTGPNTTKRTVGFIVGGAGLVSLGAAAYFFVNAGAKDDDSNAAAASSDPAVQATTHDLHEDAKSSQTMGIVFSAVGGVALITGAYLIFTSGGSKASASVAVAPAVGPHGSGFTLVGKF